nr:hypothetical protein [Acidobacteriota bacterium]
AAKALAQGGIFGYAAAAAIITQGLRYVATMRETEIGGRFAASGGGGGKGSGPKKFAEGGIVPGFDMGYDTVPALLRPGEAVLTPEQFATLARGGGGGGVEIHLHGSLPALVTEVNKAVRGRQVRLYASDTFTSRTAR